MTAHVFMCADRCVKPNHFSALRAELAVLAVLCAIREINTAGLLLCSMKFTQAFDTRFSGMNIIMKFHEYKCTYFITKCQMKKVSRRFCTSNSNLLLFHYTSVTHTLPTRPNNAPCTHCGASTSDAPFGSSVKFSI